MNLTLNPNHARAADQVANRITESGKYVGLLTAAIVEKSTTGSVGIGLAFKADSGANADFLQIWLQNGKGDELSGMKAASALLACLSLRDAPEGPVTVERYDPDTKQRNKVTVTGYPTLMNKRIGFVLQKELYTKTKGGSDAERMNIVGIFHPDSELMASEILDRKSQPEQLPRVLEWLSAKPVRDSRKAAQRATANTGSAPSGGAGLSDQFDDDIPF